ncbi:MAG: response regulator [Bacteroidales bacterium]|nr:response regulator [Bacteroidales bacterium]
MKCGTDGRIWIAVEGHGVYRHDPGAASVECVYRTASPLRSIEIDNMAGRIWFSWSGGGLFYTDDGFESVHPFLLDNGDKVYPEDIISCIHVSAYNKIYLGLEQNGVVELNKATARITRLNLSEEPLFVREIVQYSPDELWIGTESGLFIYNVRSRTWQHLVNSDDDRYSLSDNAVYSICKDRDGGLWIGTFFGGVNYLPQRIPDFSKYYYSREQGGLNGKRVRKICPDGKGCLWVATEDAGLYHFNPETGVFDFFSRSSEFTNIQCLLMDGDNLWVSTFAKGIRVIDTRTSRVKKYEFVKEPGPRLFSNNIFTMARTSSGRIYIGTMHGLQFYRPEVDGFGFVPQINGGKMVNDIMEDSGGNLWVGTISNGVYVQSARDGEWRQYLHDNADRSSVPGNNITSIFEDSRNRIWVTTYGSGFCMYEPETDSFCTYNSLNGMPGDVVYQIVEDDAGDFWISTNSGLVLFNPLARAVERVYTVEDGLLCNSFNYSSSYRDESGRIYFGCIEGMVSFSPQNLVNKRSSTRTPEIYITDFSILSDNASGSGNPLEKDIICTDSIVLRHWQNVFTVELAALGFSEDHAIMYRLDGVDGSWRRYDGGKITYSNIPSGDYCFRARFQDEYAGTGEKTLNIRIRPPFWRSTVANVLYLFVLLGAALTGIGYYHRMSVIKRRKYIREYERKKESELYDTKIAFFTNITHEIRTPLTLIKGPLDNILAGGNVDPKIARNLDIMSRNTDRLLVLVNQLLDFQKIEKESLSLKLARCNVADILESTFNRFSASMSWQHKEFSIDVRDRDICAMIDKEAFTKILSNMFTNAMKYSDRHITVILEREGDLMKLIVGNDGDVVPADKREIIFTPFYRHTNTNEQTGTGIGLYLARSLAELQYGTLSMSQDLSVNEFVLMLPLCSDDGPEEDIPSAGDMPAEDHGEPEADVIAVSGSSQDTILVVEDDVELCRFIKDSIGEKWPVITAHNGREALEVLDKNNITLIVSDIMMPEMDGIELCRIVKSDFRYTHIPLVLLTAKTTLESKIAGMNVGADVYVEKPFSLTYLMSVIANQIKSRQTLREAFLKNPLATMTTVNMSSGDTDFLSRLQSVIHENLNNPKFKMDDIAEMMHMSRANFYRKIKGVLDMSPNDYLRVERLKKAAQLLVENDYQVSEVCYMVGFSSPSYFSKCFYSQFGVNPKNFVKNQETKNQ